MTRLTLAALALVAGTAGVAFGHAGPRLEVIVENGRLAARGANTAQGDLRSYLNAISARVDTISSGFAIATLPGFDVFHDNQSLHGAGAANDLDGGDLVLTLADAAVGDAADAGPIAFSNLDPSTTISISLGDDFDNIVNTNQIGGSIELISQVGAPGVPIDDLDPDYFLQSAPATELLVLAWTISTTATLDDPSPPEQPIEQPIGASDLVFTILTPDSSAFADDAIRLERYLATPLVAGDLDRDGTATPDDFDVWASSFGAQPRFAGAGADASRNGVVNAADFTLFRDTLTPPPASIKTVLTTPEPSSAALLATPLGALGRRRRKCR